MLTKILSFLGGSVVGKVLDYLGKRADKEVAVTREARMLAVEDLRAEVAMAAILKERHKIDAAHWSTRWIRPLFAYPLAFYLIVDVLCSTVGSWMGVTWRPEPLSEGVAGWAGWVIIFYFGGRPVEKMLANGGGKGLLDKARAAIARKPKTRRREIPQPRRVQNFGPDR